MKPENSLYVTNRKDWRAWLRKNHNKKKEIWLIYYKKHTNKPRIPYDDAVEEALCYGWVDSTAKRIDEERFMQRYTPRNKNSLWSEINKKRAEKMMKLRKMTKIGTEKIKIAKKNGKWDNAYTSKKKLDLPPDLKKALIKNKAFENFNNLANTYQNMYISWVIDAKKKETRLRRIKIVVERSLINKKAGII